MSSSHFDEAEYAKKLITSLMTELDKKDPNPTIVVLKLMGCFTPGDNKTIKPEMDKELMRQAATQTFKDPGLTYDHVKKLSLVVKSNPELVSKAKLSNDNVQQLITLATNSIDAAIGRTKERVKTSSRRIFKKLLPEETAKVNQDEKVKVPKYNIDETDSNDLIDKRDSVQSARDSVTQSTSSGLDDLDDMFKDMSESPPTPRKK